MTNAKLWDLNTVCQSFMNSWFCIQNNGSGRSAHFWRFLGMKMFFIMRNRLTRKEELVLVKWNDLQIR